MKEKVEKMIEAINNVEDGLTDNDAFIAGYIVGENVNVSVLGKAENIAYILCGMVLDNPSLLNVFKTVVRVSEEELKNKGKL